MKAKFEKPMMVRGVVTVGNRHSGVCGRDNDKCAVARTLWYRHDDDLDKLERQLDRLMRVMMDDKEVSIGGCYYEYKEYER